MLESGLRGLRVLLLLDMIGYKSFFPNIIHTLPAIVMLKTNALQCNRIF